MTLVCQKNHNLVGIGLRSEHHKEVLLNNPKVSWWEIHTENFFAQGGMQLSFLQEIRNKYPLSFHGVGLSLGSCDKPSIQHLEKIKFLINRFEPFLVSEHISWSSLNHVFANDLLPLPYTSEALNVICRNILITQDYLQREILVENPSTYLSYKNSDMQEEDFINQITKKTGCKLLLDINNVFVSANNNGFDSLKYLDNIDLTQIREIHLAGHSILKTKNFVKLLDTHNDIVRDEVWSLYEYTVQKLSQPPPTLIEWDQDLPKLTLLMSEAQKATSIIEQVNESRKVTA